MRQQYKVAQNPKDHLWYVVGNCGDGYWMPVSDGFVKRSEAIVLISHQIQADKAARLELNAL
jgi:hypothetical protein